MLSLVLNLGSELPMETAKAAMEASPMSVARDVRRILPFFVSPILELDRGHYQGSSNTLARPRPGEAGHLCEGL